MLTKQKLHRYPDDGHETGVMAYRFDDDSITVLFREGWFYLYDRDRPGSRHVRTMKDLAAQGHGLSTYISKHVRENYKRKWRKD